MTVNWKYCPHCKGVLEPYESTHGKCISCGQIWHKTPPPSTIALITRRMKILLSKRAIDPNKGKWDFPGGFVHEGESAESSIVREIQEELGVTPREVKLLQTVSNPNYSYMNAKLQPLDIAFLVTLGDENITPADDVAEVKWFDVTNLPDLAFPHCREIINSLKS